jgi:hypothetical protein
MANKIIAQNGDLVLYAVDEETGYVHNSVTKKDFPEHSIVSILTKGVWDMTPLSTMELIGTESSGFHGHS